MVEYIKLAKRQRGKKSKIKKIACGRIDQRGGERKIARGGFGAKWLLEAAEAPMTPICGRISKKDSEFQSKNGF